MKYKYSVNYLEGQNAQDMYGEPIEPPHLIFRLDRREKIGRDCDGDLVICQPSNIPQSTEVNLNELENLGVNASNNLNKLGNAELTFYPINVTGLGITYLFMEKQLTSAKSILGYTDTHIPINELDLAIKSHNEQVRKLNETHNQPASSKGLSL